MEKKSDVSQVLVKKIIDLEAEVLEAEKLQHALNMRLIASEKEREAYKDAYYKLLERVGPVK